MSVADHVISNFDLNYPTQTPTVKRREKNLICTLAVRKWYDPEWWKIIKSSTSKYDFPNSKEECHLMHIFFMVNFNLCTKLI